MERRNSQGGFQRAHLIHVFTELSTDPKAFLPSRIPAPPPSVVVRACSRQHLRSHHRNFTHTFCSPALHGCGWYRQFCIPFAAPQPSVCDVSSPTSCCFDTKKDPGNVRQSAKVKSMVTMVIFSPGDFHESFGCVRVNQRFASFYFTQTAFDCCHQNLNLSFKSKTFQHLISSQPCDFFSLTEHLGICCSILCSQARVSSLDNSLKLPPVLPKNASVPAWQITLAHTSFRHSQSHRRSLAHLATALSSDDVSGWRKGAQPGTRPSGIFSHRGRTPVAVPPKKCAKQESAASGSEDTNIQFKQSARTSLHSQIASL